MGIERERKFLLDTGRVDHARLKAYSARTLVQGYLSKDGKATVRVRTFDNAEAVLTIKGPKRGDARDEFEYAIPLADAYALLALRTGRLIEKTRYRVPHGGLTVEVDVFAGELSGLVYAEIEFGPDTPEEALTLPDWLGPARNVSDDGRFTNAALAKHGKPTEA